MGRTMVVETGYPAEPAPVAKPEGRSFRKSLFRPKSLLISPLDPRELSRKLSVAKREKENERSPRSMQETYRDDDLDSPLKSSKSSRSFRSKSSPSSSRRGSLFNLSIKSANWDPKKDGDDGAPTTPYRHVPKNAASQFTRTTTVENLTEKPLIPKEALAALPSPGGPTKAAISLSEYNRLYRRTQSLCSGRPYDRTGSICPTTLGSMAEVDEEPHTKNNRFSLQAHQMKAFNFGTGREITRRRSSDSLKEKKESATDEKTEPRRNSFSDQDQRKASASSVATDGLSPFMQDFDISRRSSTAASIPSRRASLVPRDATAMNIHRVGWSHSSEVEESQDSKCKVVDIPRSKTQSPAQSPVQSPVPSPVPSPVQSPVPSPVPGASGSKQVTFEDQMVNPKEDVCEQKEMVEEICI